VQLFIRDLKIDRSWYFLLHPILTPAMPSTGHPRIDAHAQTGGRKMVGMEREYYAHFTSDLGIEVSY
jgi:hypothetical protein